MSVYKKIAAVMADMAKAGITKDQENTFDRYKFRGIDDVYNALAPVLAKHGLVVIPSVIAKEVEQVPTQKGGIQFLHRVTVDYDMYDADVEGEAPSCSARIVGEAMDRGDKGINKAMSAAYKLRAFQTFCIPTESGSHDTEEESHEIVQQLIGEHELAQIMDLIGMTNSDPKRFAAAVGVDRLDQLPLDKFAKAMDMLNLKAKKLAKEYEAEQKATAESMA